MGDRLYFSGEDVTSSASGEKVREKRISVFDGSQTVAIEEGNSVTVYQGRHEPAQLFPPHCWGLFHLEVNFPFSVYLQGTKAMKSYPKVRRLPRECGSVFEFNKVESQLAGEETIDGLDCVKVRVKRWYYTSDRPAIQDLWLAKQCNFHVAQCRTSFVEKGMEVPRDATRVAKWRELAKGVWLPEVVEWQDLSPDRPEKRAFGKQVRRLIVEKAILNPTLPKAFFTLPEIPAVLPKYVIGKDGSLVGSPHNPVPVKAAAGTTLKSIQKRLAEEEKRYNPLEVIATTRYEMLNRENLNGSVYMRTTAHERSVVAGDRLYDEEKRKANLANGTTTSYLAQQAYDGRWARQHTQYIDPPRKPQVIASLELERKDELRPLCAHTLLFHDERINSQLLSAFLASGWYDAINRYAMTVEYVDDERIDDLHCYKLKCSLPHKGSKKPDSYFLLWLARDRNLLPLRRESHNLGWSEKLPTGISFVEDLREIRPGQWFPYRATHLAHQTFSRDGLGANHLLLQWRRDVVVDRVTLDPQVDGKLFGFVEVPAGTQVYVRNEQGDAIGQFQQPQTGNLELSQDRLCAMQHEAEVNEDDTYDPKDATAPERKTRVDAARKGVAIRSPRHAGRTHRGRSGNPATLPHLPDQYQEMGPGDPRTDQYRQTGDSPVDS